VRASIEGSPNGFRKAHEMLGPALDERPGIDRDDDGRVTTGGHAFHEGGGAGKDYAGDRPLGPTLAA
jgi:hypothetical protein